MIEVLFALSVFVCLAGASLGVLMFYGRLPAHHREDDTQNVVRLIANIFVVMTSLVLGLMINSAKARYDGINRDAHSFAIDLILLDRLLLLYGSDADETRRGLLAYMERAANGKWTSGDSVLVSDKTSEDLLNEVGRGIRALKPADDPRLAVWNDARAQFQKVVERRWGLVEQAEGSIPIPLLGLVVAWLILIFGSFGLRAPRNALVVLSFVSASALMAGAIYLIVDMDAPFDGTIQISPAPLQRALAEIRR